MISFNIYLNISKYLLKMKLALSDHKLYVQKNLSLLFRLNFIFRDIRIKMREAFSSTKILYSKVIILQTKSTGCLSPKLGPSLDPQSACTHSFLNFLFCDKMNCRQHYKYNIIQPV